MIKIIVACMLMAALTGCLTMEQREHLKDSAHNAILSYMETKGQEKALEYINKLEAEGKLGKVNADKLRAAVPMGIEKLREVMEGIENE